VFARFFSVFILIAFSAAAHAEAVDCQKDPTFLQKIPGGYQVVFSCGCEPPLPSSGDPDFYSCGDPRSADLILPNHTDPVDSPGVAIGPGRPSYLGSPSIDIGRNSPTPSVRSSSSSSGIGCVGVCYGVTSRITGNPRNNYVRGYLRKDGTYVQGYTRSRRR
jgi:hypothetical protein